MSTYNQTGFAVLSTQAGYNAAMGAIDQQIQAMGLVLTADTGQTNPATCALPATSTASGYRVYKTNDTLTPIYIRINYMRGANTEPRLQIACGYSTDGAGNLGTQKSATFDFQPAETGAASNLAISGTPSRLTIAWALNASAADNQQMCFGFERDKDINGNDADTGFLMYNASNGTAQQFVPITGTIPPKETAIIVSHPSSTSTAVIGSNTLVSAPMPIKQTGGGNPGLGVCVYTGSDFSNNTVATINRYGTNVNYIVALAAAGIYGPNVAFHTMWRFE